jgi:hypothetical protein
VSLGVKIEKLPGGKFKLSQPHLIDQILENLGLNLPNTLSKPTPALSSKIIGRDVDGQPFNDRWEHRSVIGKLNFLEKLTRLTSDMQLTSVCASISILKRATL